MHFVALHNFPKLKELSIFVENGVMFLLYSVISVCLLYISPMSAVYKMVSALYRPDLILIYVNSIGCV